MTPEMRERMETYILEHVEFADRLKAREDVALLEDGELLMCYAVVRNAFQDAPGIVVPTKGA